MQEPMGRKASVPSALPRTLPAPLAERSRARALRTLLQQAAVLCAGPLGAGE